MNYQKIYDNLIIKILLEHRIKLRKNQEGYVYYERHHIIPRCMDGPDVAENLLLSTAREHYFFHKLLTFIYPHHRGNACAFHKMTFSKKYGKIVSSRDYAHARELLSLIPMSEETRKKQRRLGEKHPLFGKHLSKKVRLKISVAITGEKNARYVKLTNQQINQIIDLYVNEKHTIAEITKIVMLGYSKIESVLIKNNVKIDKTRKTLSSKKGKTFEEIYGVEKAKKLKKQQSESIMGEKHPFFGKHFSKDHCKKLSESHSDKSAWSRGKNLSEEHCKNISEGLKKYYKNKKGL